MKESNVLDFINAHKVYYFDWLRQNTENFPFVCTLASEVIGSYLKVIYQEGMLVHGSFNIEITGRKAGGIIERISLPFHAWLKFEDFIIDFTAFQFLKPVEDYRDKTNPALEFYSTFIKRYQGDCIITPNSALWSLYIPKKQYHCRFNKLVNNNFETYLEAIKECKQFKNYIYNRGLKKV